MTRIYVFPGQGSQAEGMGRDLFDRFPEEEKQADGILGYSIRKLCLEDPDKKLNSTEYTQPALFIINALSYLAALSDGKPDFTAGHSLGEYNALFAAGVFSFADGIKLVQKRGAIMAKAFGGGMAAVINLDPDKIKDALQKAGFGSIDIANYNSPSQTVISGPKQDIANAKEAIVRAGAKMYLPLNVSGAFHSRYMQESRTEFEQYIAGFSFNKPEIPVVANSTASVYDEKIKETLAAQITSPVRWVETVQFFKKQSEPVFKEIGPGNVLTRLINQI